MTYQAQFNTEARQWDVVDEDGEIVAMFGGGNKGEREARGSAERLTRLEAEGWGR